MHSSVNYLNNVYSGPDSATLITLANGCPFTDGIAVYQARALYNEVYNSAILFYDNCPNQFAQRQSSGTSETESIEKKQNNFLIYPNPAKDELFISASKESKEVTIVIQDINGRVVYEIQILLSNGLGKINTELENGIYFVTVKNENAAAVQKLLITK